MGCAREPKNRTELEQEFQAEYGFVPPAKISDLRCREVSVGDTWSKWILFTYDEETVQRIISAGFTNASPELQKRWGTVWSQDLFGSRRNPNAPKWWPDPPTPPIRVYYKIGDPRDFAGFKYVWIDERSKVVYAKSAAWH
jgi:hypothetical protein